MKLTGLASLVLPLLLSPLTTANPLPKSKPSTITTYSETVIFDPPSNYTIPRTLYARTLELPSGVLLSTWENYSGDTDGLVYFPIYRSTDHGATWKEISRVEDTHNKIGLRYQPFLYYLDQKLGGYPAGTILLAGNSIPEDLSTTELDLYASRDNGVTWEFVSEIAKGGEALPNNGLTPVWEPFLLVHKGKLICYYSDQRDNATYGQKLVHQTTTDLKNWGPVVDDVAYPTYTDRPGMPILAQLPNKDYIYIYEYGSFFNTSTYSFPLYFRIASDPEKIAAAEGQRLVVSDGTQPTSSPYVVWSPYGGKHGTIIASSGTQSSIFVNQNLGQGEWTEIATPESTSYTRDLRVLSEDNGRYLLIAGGGVLNGADNQVTASLVDLSTVL
ncbi:Oligoxyloglucan reducing end-specific cellobiohydrolase [Aspergillus fijiensis CBS 313.89]|uniref:Oligoxyloglucan reducing end-specific cellobiohydrolase n=1 Tax=Aspergillus fijiensis CBS 313.89 TaxID=1448319 RepID=A0A8G1RXY6_9EURO|nr:Oligoxyloglucan reducing end-specific cellobiohydrolase [Aspergillus fijiensis CBS 313.89]RAK82027.1 Oligoxyloglucan reducing end-specific cellobiohydrolase [Aspergillus fijiensis CBS 313.89]